MAALPEPIVNLISSLSKLPGIGPRSAERLALHIVQADKGQISQLAANLLAATNEVGLCIRCGALTQNQPCGICSDSRRDNTLVCVVERAIDVINIDKSGTYHGRFHVLGGKISPLNGVGPEDLKIEALENRLKAEAIQELVLALPSDVEGDATSYYLSRHFTAQGVKVTRIAQGLPVGSGLEFADQLTLSRAIEGRRELS